MPTLGPTTPSVGAAQAITRGVAVRVTPTFLAEHSDPAGAQFTWSYTVEIENRSLESVKLVSRHWVITDANGRKEEIRGPGVVGQQPTLEPSDAFRYDSGCRLATPTGTMSGDYQMVTKGGGRFDAAIPEVSLPAPPDGAGPA